MPRRSWIGSTSEMSNEDFRGLGDRQIGPDGSWDRLLRVLTGYTGNRTDRRRQNAIVVAPPTGKGSQNRYKHPSCPH